MNDWRSYDSVAETYDQLWGPRFETAARHLLAFAAPTPGCRLLDLGTGTAAVASALGDTLKQVAFAGCDLSLPMLLRCRQRAVRRVLADVTCLPFRSGSFDLVTANCVLSHVRDFRQALAESIRVLSRPSRLAVSSWGPASDPFDAAWRELICAAVGKDHLERAIQEATPWDSRFSTAKGLRAALLAAGFSRVRTERIELGSFCTVEEYLASRRLGVAGRFARQALGGDAWTEFLARAERAFRQQFGDHVAYTRPLLVSAAATA
jgi:ubiquinone/menaquinone biosynthesis C-methylase UbiE